MFKYAFIAASVLATSVPLRTVVAQRDSVLLDLAHREGTSHLMLTPRHVEFEFTREGVERARRQADSTSAPTSGWLARVVSQSVAGALRGIHIAYDLADIESAETDGATVRLWFRRSSDQDKFEFDAVDGHSAQQFVKRLNELLPDRKR